MYYIFYYILLLLYIISRFWDRKYYIKINLIFGNIMTWEISILVIKVILLFSLSEDSEKPVPHSSDTRGENFAEVRYRLNGSI